VLTLDVCENGEFEGAGNATDTKKCKKNPASDQREAGIIQRCSLNLLCAWRGWFLPGASAHVSEYSGLHFAILRRETEIHQANNHSGDAQLTKINSVKALVVQFNYITYDEIDRYF
jgi:hypothetical protein